MITLKRTNSSEADFIDLVKYLDADLKIRDGEDHDLYNQFNSITNIKYCIVAYEDQIPIGCGGIKAFDESTIEVKRMYVKPEYRGKGVAGKILMDLEFWAKELGYQKCVLETGVKQPEAIALYKKYGYDLI